MYYEYVKLRLGLSHFNRPASFYENSPAGYVVDQIVVIESNVTQTDQPTFRCVATGQESYILQVNENLELTVNSRPPPSFGLFPLLPFLIGSSGKTWQPQEALASLFGFIGVYLHASTV